MTKTAEVAAESVGRAGRRGLLAIVGVFVIVALALTAIFDSAEWYADRVLVPRYCENPEAAVALVGEILTEAEPAGTAKTRPYIIAAKLIYLVPRQDGETVEAYVSRLPGEIRALCR